MNAKKIIIGSTIAGGMFAASFGIVAALDTANQPTTHTSGMDNQQVAAPTVHVFTQDPAPTPQPAVATQATAASTAPASAGVPADQPTASTPAAAPAATSQSNEVHFGAPIQAPQQSDTTQSKLPPLTPVSDQTAN